MLTQQKLEKQTDKTKMKPLQTYKNMATQSGGVYATMLVISLNALYNITKL